MLTKLGQKVEGAPEFVLAAVGPNLNSCPSGYDHVLTLQSCKDAGKFLGLQAKGPRDCTAFGGGRHGASGMRGCTINKGNNCLHFNVENLHRPCQGSKCHQKSQYVCKYSSPKEFVLAAVGPNLNSCPSGYEHVLTLQSCKDAGKFLGLQAKGPRDCTGF